MRSHIALTERTALLVLLSWSWCFVRADHLPRRPPLGPMAQVGGRAYEYMALDSYANPVSEDYCPPAPPSGGKFSVFGFLSMMVSISVTVTNILNAISNNNNNNNNDNNDNNNNDNNNNNNDLNENGGGMQDQSNAVPVRINQVGQNNANADLGAEGSPVLTGARPTPSNPNTISFAGKNIDFARNQTTGGSSTYNALTRPNNASVFGLSPSSIETPNRMNRNTQPHFIHRRPKSALNEASCLCRAGRGAAEGIAGAWWEGCLAKVACDEEDDDEGRRGFDLLASRVTKLVTRVFTRRLLNEGKGVRTSSPPLPCSSLPCLPLALLRPFL
ncbi:homeobox protein 2-like [Penaeus monodon]|uniref:homeobox protein 2-like n=1 Tax=Penaeus monodon TaxID=6687 RepID=UPI0018A762E9|nr:homeobox protein 2-like [Penaeus monodon]